MSEEEKTSTFVQWKGTNLCMDLYCECSHHSHIDGYFAYNVRCPECGVVYRMPTNLALERVEPADDDLVLMDTSEAILNADNEWSGSIGDSVEDPWAQIKTIKPYAEVRAEEHS